MRTIEKIYDVSARNKLTVTSDRAVIRFKQGSSKEECERVERFLTRVAQEIPQCEHTVRGHLAFHEESDTLYILMRNESKSFSVRYFEKEHAPA